MFSYNNFAESSVEFEHGSCLALVFCFALARFDLSVALRLVLRSVGICNWACLLAFRSPSFSNYLVACNGFCFCSYVSARVATCLLISLFI